MPGSLFKSRPKSDRRLEWRTLKANFAKIPANKTVNVEIGLGKELDDFQKQIDKAILLEDDQATPTALAALIQSAAKVKQSVATLEPKVKGNDSMTKFLAALKKDADWWTTTAKGAHADTGHYSTWDTDAVALAVPALLKLKPELDKMDVLLKNAQKKTPTYDPPVEVTRWPSYTKDIRPNLTKLTMLAKDKNANHAAIVKLLKTMKEPLSSLTWLMRGYDGAKFKNLPNVADWAKVQTTAEGIEKLLDEPTRKIGGL
jgi:hypothetical protein